MTHYSCRVTVPYSSEQMQMLVADVRSYPDFIHWIRSLSVRDETSTTEKWMGRALATVGFKGLTERFTTDVESDHLSRTISVNLVSGPFRRLKNQWRFEDHENGCDIHFNIDFEFSNLILRMLLKANFDRAVRVLIAIFTEEAHRRYGNQPDALA